MQLERLTSEESFFRGREKRGNMELLWNPFLSIIIGYYPRSFLEVKRDGKVITRVIRHNTDGYMHNCYSFINNKFFISGGLNGKVFIYNLRDEKVAELVGHEGGKGSFS